MVEAVGSVRFGLKEEKEHRRDETGVTKERTEGTSDSERPLKCHIS